MAGNPRITITVEKAVYDNLHRLAYVGRRVPAHLARHLFEGVVDAFTVYMAQGGRDVADFLRDFFGAACDLDPAELRLKSREALSSLHGLLGEVGAAGATLRHALEQEAQAARAAKVRQLRKSSVTA